MLPNYQTQVDVELDRAIQARAVPLYAKGQLKDADGEAAKNDPSRATAMGKRKSA